MAKRGLQFLPQKKATEASPLGASIELGVGDILRMTRERKGQELQSVANQLRIRLAYLEAIEEGRYKDLPGSTYAVGFVRSYGDYLELDGADIVRRFREEVARIHGRTRLIPPVIAADGTIPPAAILLLSIVGLGIAYGAWYYLSSSDQTDIPVVQEVPDRLINAPDGAQPEAAHAPAAGLSQDGSSVTPPDGAAPTPPAEMSADAPPGSAESVPGTAAGLQDDAGTADGTTTSSTLSTIMAPEPMPPAPDATPPASTVTAPPPAPAAPPAATASSPETAPPASGSATTSTADTGSSTPLVPSAPLADPAADQTPATGSEIADAPATASPPPAAAAPQPAAESTTTTPSEAAAPEPGPSGPASGTQNTAATENGIPAAPSLPAVPEVESTEPQQTAAAFSGARIRIHARLDTWVKIVDHNGRTVLNRVLTSGESYDVPDEPGLKMITGNAGGMDIVVDGAAIAPLGEPGKVRRDVALDPEKLKAGTAIPQ